MFQYTKTSIIIYVFLNLNFLLIINTQDIPLCDALNDIEGNDNDENNSLLKLRRIRALCDAIQSSRTIPNKEESDYIPDFDLAQIDSENDANQILKRFRRSRFSSGGRSSSSSSGSRSSSSGSGFSSGSRSSSSGGSSRIFGGGSSSSSGSSGSGTRIFSRGSSSSSGSGNRLASRSSSSSSSSGGSGVRMFSRTPTSSNTGSRVKEALRAMLRKPTSSSSGGLSGTGGSKPSLGDKIRKITHGGGGSSSGGFGSGGSKFGMGGSGGGSSGNAWVRTGKTFLPHAVRFGKRYYQRRKYNKGMYAGIGAGAGYYAGSRMNNHGNYDSHGSYGYPPVVDEPPSNVDGRPANVFYCLQEDLNTTLVNKTLNDEGLGVCNISGKLVSCPIEIECKIDEADNCCEDEQGTPFCCGGQIPDEYVSNYGGYGDDMDDAAESIHQILNVVTAVWIVLTTLCFTMWYRRGQ